MLILGLRSSKKRSLLCVNEHFESKHNDKVALLDSFYFSIRRKLASKSSIISSTASKPAEMRSKVGAMPARTFASSLNCLWVVEAGWVTTVIESPIIVILAANFNPSTKRTVPSKVPSSSTEITHAAPLRKYFCANA